jgi:nucleoside-diphosphate-sugar epimerase
MKTAAVVGASGMLGRELVAQLRHANVDVLTIGRRAQDAIRFDLEQPAPAFDAPLPVVDALFHCASSFGGDDQAGCIQNVRVNEQGALHLIALAQHLRCPTVVYAGSISSQPDDATITSYGLSKAHAEAWLSWGMARTGGRACSLRLAQLYDTDGACCVHQPWFGRIVAYVSRGLELRLPPPSSPRNFVHVSDAARLMIKAAHERLEGVWPLCHDERLHYEEIARIADDIFGASASIVIDPHKSPFRSNEFPNSAHLFERLTDRPRISMREGLALIRQMGQAMHFGPMDVT